MFGISDVERAFPELTNLKPLPGVTGQREVLSCALNNGERVALKLFKKAKKAEDRLNREVAAIVKLGSKYVPLIHSFGIRPVAGNDKLFVVESWIDGDLYENTLKTQPNQPLIDALKFGRFLLNACRDFEQKDLVHRDIKPKNLMTDKSGKQWVIDFGIVRHLDLESVTETEQSFGLGTFGYGAPEQMRNIKAEINTMALRL